MVAGATVEGDAQVFGDVRIFAGSAVINNKISGNVFVRASDSLSFGPKAKISGNIYYTGPQAAQTDPQAKISAVNYTSSGQSGWRGTLAGLFSLGFLIKFLAWIIAGFAVVKFRKTFAFGLSEDLRKKPWQNLGWGLLAIIAIPIAVIILFFSFIGYYLGLLLGIIYILMLLSGTIIAALSSGYLILSRLNKPGKRPKTGRRSL